MPTESMQSTSLFRYWGRSLAQAATVLRRNCRSADSERLAALHRANGAAVLWVNDRGRVLDANHTALQMFQSTLRQMQQYAIDDLLVSGSGTTIREQLRTAVRTSGFAGLHRAEASLKASGAKAVPVALAIEPVGGSAARECVVVVNDLSPRQQSEHDLHRYAQQLLMTKTALEKQNRDLENVVGLRTEQLRLAKDAAEQASEAKSDFLANMSHEFRTPLHGILSFARFGLRRIDSSSRDKLLSYFSQIESCSNVLLRLVNQLLDLAKLEGNDISPHGQWCDARKVIERVGSEFQALREERSLSLTLNLGEPGVLLPLSDEHCAQVIRNLLGNAIKMSPQDGAITIDVARTATATFISLSDQGPGIPPSELRSIFERFAQSSKTKLSGEGTGLGLAICRRIVERIGGEIWAENREQGGARFRVQLPLLTNLPTTDSPEPVAVESCI